MGLTVKKKRKTCFLCEKTIRKLIDIDDYDFDETPDDYGFADTRASGQTICAECVRGNVAEKRITTGDDWDKEETNVDVINEKTGEKITLSGKNKDVWLRKQGAALQDAVRIYEEEELDDTEDLVKHILSYDPDEDPIVTSDDIDDDEGFTPSW